jgi:ribulose-5-phosphate 4-epimerase/fuculose-1-phosphate aldolase
MEQSTELTEKVATACQILGLTGLGRGILGHVSARVPGTDEMWISCRGRGAEHGLRFHQPEAVRRVDFDGNGEGKGEYSTPGELPIHGEIFRAFPDVGCVVHAHPTAVLLCGLAGVEFKLVFDSFDPIAKRLAREGVPVFPRAASVRTADVAKEMIAVMGDKRAVLMRGHGITVAARTIEEATIQAVSLEALARISWHLAQSGKDIPELEPETTYRGNENDGQAWSGMWNYYSKLLEWSAYVPIEPSIGIDDVRM